MLFCLGRNNQRLSGEGRDVSSRVELLVRVPLEKEVPVVPVLKNAVEENEFPELTKVNIFMPN